jgi:hypothetical protein
MEPVNLLKPPTVKAAPRPPARAPVRPPVAPATTAVPPNPRRFAFGEIRPATAQRVGIYGPGGIGKSSCSCRAPGPVAIFDFDDSLPVLKPSLGNLDIRPVQDVHTWLDLREALHDPALWEGIRTVVIDSLTRAEQLAIAHTLAAVKNDKNQPVTSIEGYGFGKGYRHVFETFLLLLGDLDAHIRAGRNVVLVMHECTATVPNPEGEDYIRWEPRLQGQNNGNIRLATKEWLDHLLCIRFDLTVNADGKASGGETRTIYPVESAVHMAKSRSLKEALEFTEGSDELWRRLFASAG